MMERLPQQVFFSLARLLLVYFLFSVAPVIAAEQTMQLQRAQRLIGHGDLITGMKVMRIAAEAGYAPAQAALGEILDKAEEDKEAVVLYRKAAEQGNAAGQYGLGMEYATGEGITKDLKQAEQWIRKAAEQDYDTAVDVMAQAYRKGGLGLAPDPVQADVWHQRALRLKQEKPKESKHEKK